MNKFLSQKGFSIAEVMVAVMIFSIGILSVVEVFPLYHKMSRLAEKSSTAVFLAQEKIEAIFSLPYSEITVGQYEIRHRIENDGRFSNYERKTDVSFVDGSYNNSNSDLGLKKITTTVYWNEAGLEKSEKLTTLISSQ